MIEKTIDCLFIGHNDMDFVEYEKTTRKMGVNSGAYRDLNLNFISYEGKPYCASAAFNLFCFDRQSHGTLIKPIEFGETFSNTIAYLGTYLHRRGFTFDYVNSFQKEKDELAEKLKKENILTIAVTTTFYVAAFPVVEIVDFIRKHNRSAWIIIGGPFISSQIRVQDPMVVQYLLETIIGADIYVNSPQGESTLIDILKALKNNLPLTSINNIYYKNGNGYRWNPMVKEDNQLSQNMVDWVLFADRLGEYVNVRTSISCPYSCAFCGFPEHAGTFQTAPVEAIEAELERLRKIESVTCINFVDDTFNVPVKRFKEMLRMMIKNKYSFKWHSHFRCQFMDEETGALMKESGCEGIFLGFESGSDKILENMNKAVTVQKYHEGLEILKKYNILTHGSFIIGFPGETEETARDTMRFIEQSGIDFYQVQLWYCEPITPVWRQKEKFNLKGESFEWSHSTMDTQTACDLIDHMYLSIDRPVSVPKYNFDFEHLFHLTHRGLSIGQVKNFLKVFNKRVKEKLSNPSQPEVGTGIVRDLKESCRFSSQSWADKN